MEGKETRAHRLSAAVFLVYWLVVFGLDAFGWHKAANRPEDMVRTVIYLHLLLPILAGAMVSIWRRLGPAGISGGMLVGGVVLMVDAAALLTHEFIAFHLEEFDLKAWTAIFEGIALFIGIGLAGSLLGLLVRAVGPANVDENPLSVARALSVPCPHQCGHVAAGTQASPRVLLSALARKDPGENRCFRGWRRGTQSACATFQAVAALAPFAPWRVTILLGAALPDAASALAGHGGEMRTASPISAAPRAISGPEFWRS